MRFTDPAGAGVPAPTPKGPDDARLRALAAWASAAGLGLLAACSPAPPPPAPLESGGGAPAAPSAPLQPTANPPSRGGVPSTTSGATNGPAGPHAGSGVRHGAPPITNAGSWEAYRHRAAHRLVEANPGRSYLGPVHEPLLGIPVLQIELNGDGSVRAIVVLRHAKSARDTTRLAEEAVRRAAPFGDVTHLPRPWRYTETFLFDEQRRFKPRTLDE